MKSTVVLVLRGMYPENDSSISVKNSVPWKSTVVLVLRGVPLKGQ